MPEPVSGTYRARDFTFHDGEILDEVTLAYATLGTPHRNAAGEIDNAVLLLHGTGGNGRHFLTPAFMDHLFGPGQPLDAGRFYLILPDSLGHGLSSRPSDGQRMAFPPYDYADMVEGHRRLLLEHLGIARLALILGVSMGGMLTFEWAVTHPGMARAFIPMGCYPIEIAGQNRMQRKLQIDAIKADPVWAEGDYIDQPLAGLRAAAGISLLLAGSALSYQGQAPTRETADALLDETLATMIATRDANDTLYQIEASRNYDPWDRLERIFAPLLWINFEDDLVAPPSLGVAHAAMARIPEAEFILIPASTETRGHMTLLAPHIWGKHVAHFLSARGLTP